MEMKHFQLIFLECGTRRKNDLSSQEPYLQEESKKGQL